MRALRSGLARAFVLAAGLAACATEDPDSSASSIEAVPPEPSPVSYVGIEADARTFSDLDAFAARYWELPIPPQGPPPTDWSGLESSLRPTACATCHPVQHSDWRATLHAGAYSPGLSGQLIEWEEVWPGTVRSCLLCHAPLFEQSAWIEAADGSFPPNPAYDPVLRDEGIACAACHVRGRARYGPPRRDGSLAPSPDGSPHGGVRRTPFFEDSRFCSGCHQFAAPAPNGKSIQNTYEEWRASRWAEEGVSCQSCHMPDRRHLWRGIHDPEMVRSGITVEWHDAGDRVGLRIVNSGTGHHFPTYVTPAVSVEVVPLDDGSGRRLETEGGRWEIRREVEGRTEGWVELSDTRIAAGDTALFLIEVPRDLPRVRARIVVSPGAVYEGVFEELLAGAPSDSARVLVETAHARAVSGSYVLFEETVARDVH